MQKAFKHPLARRATIAKLRRGRGAEETVLVIVTTLELDAEAEGYNQKHVTRLRHAAEAHLEHESGIGGYVLINRPKEWDA
jgi:hypothetical protein